MLVKLGNYVELRQGLAINAQSKHLISTKKSCKYPYPLLKIVDMMNNDFSTFVSSDVNKNVIAQRNDIIYTRTGQIGLAFRGFNGVVHNNSFIISLLNDKLDKDFLFTILNSNFVKKQALTMAKNSVQPDLTHSMFKSIQIPLYDINTQKKIAKILISIESQLERNNVIVKRLQVLAQATFNRFFSSENNLISLVDFPYIKVIKPGIIKFDGKKHYIATAEITGEEFNYNAPLIEYESRENRANMQPTSNSVWFAKMKNSIKHIYVTCYDKLIKQNYIFSTGFCGITCEEFAFEYMINYLNLSYFEKKKDITSHGATMEGINNEDLKSFKIHLPTKDKLVLFHNKSKEIYYEISRIRQVTFQLNCLKKKLLPLLINSQLQ